MAESPGPRSDLGALAADASAQRRATLHALHVLEYALGAPAPRRHRTWLHRVAAAIEALHAALHAQLPNARDPLGLLDEIALADPSRIEQTQRLQQELLDLTIALTSLRECVEPDPMIPLDPDDIRRRLSTLTTRFREHQAREADLVYEAIGLRLDDR